MTLADLTAAVLVAVTAGLIAYDVWVRVKDPTGDSTISWVFLTAAKRWPVLAFALGYLCGHLTFQNCQVP